MLVYAPLEAIIVFIISSPLIFLAFRRHYTFLQKLCSVILAVYIVYAVKYFFFPVYFDRESFPAYKFAVEASLFSQYSGVGIGTAAFQILGNIAAFVPLTFLTAVIYLSCRSFRGSFLLSVLASVSIELIQLCIDLATQIANRAVDITDILLNVIGGLCGYLCFRVFAAIFPRAKNSA